MSSVRHRALSVRTRRDEAIERGKWRIAGGVLVLLMAIMTGCSAKLEGYREQTPVFALDQWFIGKFEAAGGFFDRFGTLQRRFTMSLSGRKEGDKTILEEELRYTDGEVAHRRYEISQVSPGKYEATADGVVGKATIDAVGNTLRWQYQLRQKINGSEWTLTFDDWMHLVDETTLLDRAQVSKFGVNLGEVVLVARKVSSE